MSSEEAAREGPWVILSRIPEIIDDTAGGDIPSGRDVGFVFNVPPRVSFLQVPARIPPPLDTSAVDYPAIAAADPSGYIIFCDRYHSGFAEYLVWLRDERQDGDPFVPAIGTGDYYLFDAATGVVTLLPDYPYYGTRDPGSTGLIRRGDEFLIAQLQCPPDHMDHALWCYSTTTGRWTTKTFDCNSVNLEKLCSNGVIAHGGRLWWIDLIGGIFTCNPFADKLTLRHIRYPIDVDVNLGTDVITNLHRIFQTSCVNLSGGHLRYVRIGGDNAITMWRLNDPPVDDEWPLDSSAAGPDPWTLEHHVLLTEIWADEGYKVAGLQEIPPVVALVHPHMPEIVYLIDRAKLFSVDMHRRKVLDWQPFNVAEALPECPSSKLFIPWQLPRKERSPGVIAGLSSRMSEVLKFSKARLSNCFGSFCDAAATAEYEEVPLCPVS